MENTYEVENGGAGLAGVYGGEEILGGEGGGGLTGLRHVSIIAGSRCEPEGDTPILTVMKLFG